MAGILEPLDTHHAQIERQLAAILRAARAADWAAYRARFAVLRAAVLDHMDFEEEALFPELARVLESDTEVLGLRAEHELLVRHLDTLGSAAPEHDPAGVTAELEDLTEFMRRHHERELKLCYPAADRLASVNAGLARGARDLAVDGAARLDAAPPAPALDLRGLQPPEPIVRIFAALEREPGKPLRAILPHEPVPLYSLLRERGFRHVGAARADGGYDLLIEKA